MNQDCVESFYFKFDATYLTKVGQQQGAKAEKARMFKKRTSSNSTDIKDGPEALQSVKKSKIYILKYLKLLNVKL